MQHRDVTPGAPHLDTRDERAARYDLFERYPDGHARAGEHVEREHTCELCTMPFTQLRVAPRLREIVQQQGLFAELAFDHALPDGWTPRFCPPCERLELARLARVAQQRRAADRGVARADGPPDPAGPTHPRTTSPRSETPPMNAQTITITQSFTHGSRKEPYQPDNAEDQQALRAVLAKAPQDIPKLAALGVIAGGEEPDTSTDSAADGAAVEA